MSTNKYQMDTDVTNLTNALNNEPENIKNLITASAKDFLDEYAECCCSKDFVFDGDVDVDGLVMARFILPSLDHASSYKHFGFRFFEFEVYFSVYTGKNYTMTVEVCCEEHINDSFCTKLDNGKAVIACNWLEPYMITIKDVKKNKGVMWQPEFYDDEEPVSDLINYRA